MTKAEFVSQVAAKAGISRAAAARAVDAVIAIKQGTVRPPDVSPSPVRQKRPSAGKRSSSPGEPASVGEIRELAVRVWENPVDAEEFLTTPHGLLNGETPLSLARTADGAERVRNILLALEYGLPV